MATNGVETVRYAMRWDVHAAVRRRGLARLAAALDADGGGGRAAAGSRVLPGRAVDAGLGRRARATHRAAVAIPPTFGRFLAALVARYGPPGSLWAERPDLPRLPIRAWQIWNEPNLTRYWTRQAVRADLREAAARRARARCARADPGATVVLGGLPNESWKALRRSTAPAGTGAFDAVALHPYTRKPGRRAPARPLRPRA